MAKRAKAGTKKAKPSRHKMIKVPKSIKFKKAAKPKEKKNPVMSEAQFKKELAALKRIHPLGEHKREQKILKDAKKIEWLHIPSDKELKQEIEKLHKNEVAAAKLLTPEDVGEYPKLPSVKQILKEEKTSKKVRR